MPRNDQVISQESYQRFLREWHTGTYGTMRLGQAFWSRFSDQFDVKEDSELFYETSKDKVTKLIADRYLYRNPFPWSS